MIKKLSTVFCLLSMLSLQANNLLEHIPVQSKIRTYCLENKDNKDTVALIRLLEETEQLPNQEYAMHQLGRAIVQKEKKIMQLDGNYALLQKENIENYKEYYFNKKAKLKGEITLLLHQKSEIEKKYISLTNIPEHPSFQEPVNAILKKVDSPNYEQEYACVAEGLNNVYQGTVRPWNTYTTKGKIEQIVVLPLVTIGVVGALIGFVALCSYCDVRF